MSETESTKSSLTGLSEAVRSYVSLLIEDAKLNAAEKLTRLLSAIALCSLLTILTTVILVFVSIAAGVALAAVIKPLWAFVAVASLYILMVVVLICYRTQLLVDPIARFISRLLLDAPKTPESAHDKPASLS